MKKKIMFFANHASFFISHRLNIFQEAKKKKYDFLLIIGKSSSKKMEKVALKTNQHGTQHITGSEIKCSTSCCNLSLVLGLQIFYHRPK